ncbi:MAG: hypothetical protein ACI8XB_001148 [Patiriisocius sp.]|jgi:hypothetical protein
MIIIGDKLVSEDLFEKHFVCDLSACKGECCVSGDSGAPLAKGESDKLKEVLEKVKPYMKEDGLRAVEQQGVSVIDSDGDEVTPLINGKECAFTFFDDKGIAKCSIEKAYREGEIDFYKPISCHMYPIRVKQLSDFTALNYHHWPICEAACDLGDKLKVTAHQFLKEPLIRAYGEEWYEQLGIVFEQWKGENGK